jgi:hypothetical protein
MRESLAKLSASSSWVVSGYSAAVVVLEVVFEGTKVGSRLRARIMLLHSPHPGAFCAGADLRERKTMSPTQVSSFLDSLRSLVGEIEALKIPTIAVVDGFALGGGTEIALGCDMRVGGKSGIPDIIFSWRPAFSSALPCMTRTEMKLRPQDLGPSCPFQRLNLVSYLEQVEPSD